MRTVYNMTDQNIVIFLIGSIWLIGGNIVVIKSLKEQNLSLMNLVNPLLLSKMRVKDWIYIFILAVVTLSLFAISHKAGWIK